MKNKTYFSYRLKLERLKLIVCYLMILDKLLALLFILIF